MEKPKDSKINTIEIDDPTRMVWRIKVLVDHWV